MHGIFKRETEERKMDWKSLAISYIPEEVKFIRGCDSPFEFWVDMSAEIENCVSKENDEKAEKIMKLAVYCSTHAETITSEMGQAALVSFLHDIPLKTKLWPLLPKFLPKKYFFSSRKNFFFLQMRAYTRK